MSPRDVVIAGAARTPIGAMLGALSSVPAPRLGAVAIRAALERAGVGLEQVEQVWMGCVLQGGIGQAPARQAALFAGLPSSVSCVTLNKVCGSGLQAVMTAFDQVRLGEADVVVAGGMENMSQVPYALPGARAGYRLGDRQAVDLVVHDGLWDVYNDFHMGSAAELCARERHISRADQDDFARESYRRANAAIAEGLFEEEIATVDVKGRRGQVTVVDTDEEPARGKPEKFARLRPAFDRAEGTVTAANASSINDGAAAVVVMSAEKAAALGVTPLATIRAYANHAQAPEWFTTAPARAIARLMDRTGFSVEDVDLYEINEAFAVVSIATNRELGLDPARVNVRGGAVALGHPIGASGCRILVTLLYSMKSAAVCRGVASLCIGGGEAVALMVEREGGTA